jgi:protein transport protein SEC31
MHMPSSLSSRKLLFSENDEDIALVQNSTNDEPPQAYKLAALYDRYFEYAELLSSQGLVNEGVKVLDQTPAGYKGTTPDSDLEPERRRFARATEMPAIPTAVVPGRSKAVVPAPTLTKASYPAYTGFTQSVTHHQPAVHAQYELPPTVIMHHQPAVHAAYEPPSTVNDPYAPLQHSTGTAPNYQNRQFSAQNSLTQPPHLRSQQAPMPSIPPPPRVANGTPANVGAPPPPPKRDAGGWNDAPVVATGRGPAALNQNKPQAITSPFPN